MHRNSIAPRLVPSEFRRSFGRLRRSMGLRRCDIMRFKLTDGDVDNWALQTRDTHYDFLHGLPVEETTSLILAYAIEVFWDAVTLLKNSGMTDRLFPSISLWDDDFRELGHLWPQVTLSPPPGHESIAAGKTATGELPDLIRRGLHRIGMETRFRIEQFESFDPHLASGTKQLFLVPTAA